MLKSMTGFGIATTETDNYTATAEIRSLNSKFMDLFLKLPKEFSDKDIEVRNLITTQLERGKVSFSLEIKEKATLSTSKLSINEDLLKDYYQQLQHAALFVGSDETDLFKYALSMPKVMDSDQSQTNNVEEWQALSKIVAQAITKCQEFRISEGNVLAGKFSSYVAKIRSLLEKIEQLDPLRIENIKNRIKSNLNEFIPVDQIDKNRFEQELIYYIEKLDISEEKVRLRSHLDYFLETMNSADANGKKLGFISQEIGREINTIGSKVNDAQMQRSVVEMKEELEKIKEQALNIL
jgi:uncharacterized protein (TIGR00255 family)